MKTLPALTLTVLLLTAYPSVAAQTAIPSPAEQTLSEKEINRRAKSIGQSLRCVVCQNQSIEESDASLALDMRTLVRARVQAGDSEDDVIAFMQERYGDFVLLKPPVQKNTYVLWFAPFLLALLGLFWFAVQSRRKVNGTAPTAIPLTEEELAKIDKL